MANEPSSTSIRIPSWVGSLLTPQNFAMLAALAGMITLQQYRLGEVEKLLIKLEARLEAVDSSLGDFREFRSDFKNLERRVTALESGAIDDAKLQEQINRTLSNELAAIRAVTERNGKP